MQVNRGTILYIGSFELPDKNAAAHRVLANGRAIRDLGYNVVFVGATRDEAVQIKESEKEIFFGFDCYKRSKAKTNRQWFKFLTDIQPYKEVFNKYSDVCAIIGYNLPSLVLIKLRNEAKNHRISIYSDCTEWYEIKKKGNSLLKFIVRYTDVFMRMKMINRNLDGIIAISQYLYKYYNNKGIKTIQIPPLVDLTEDKWKTTLQPSSSKIIQLLYAGAPFSLYKEPSYKDRLDLIIESLFQLKKENIFFQMHIIGVDREDVANNFPELRPALTFLDDSLIFYGKIEHLRVIEVLKSVDYSLFLRYNSKSVKAGFPTKFVESISCGIPVLTNRNSNLTDYLTEGENGYWINIDNKESIKSSLKKAISVGTEKIIQMKENCLQSKTFDYRNYKCVFNDFLNENH